MRPLAPGERVELDLMSIADLDGEPIVLADDDDDDDDDESIDDDDGVATRDASDDVDGVDESSARRGARMSDTDTEVDVEARGAIEAVVLAATEPVPPALLAQLVELPTDAVEELCEELAAEYEREGRGFQLARVAGGYRFQTHPDVYAYVERFVLEGQTARLSGPALETLAIVAYKQPIARAQISAIRGVNVDATLKTLVPRGYIEESGHERTPGNPTLFSTTTAFLERLGVDSLADLPPLADFVPESSLVEALERGLRGVDVGDVDERARATTSPSRSRARRGAGLRRASRRAGASGDRDRGRTAAEAAGARRASGRAARARC